jgi:hypothetical protein
MTHFSENEIMTEKNTFDKIIRDNDSNNLLTTCLKEYWKNCISHIENNASGYRIKLKRDDVTVDIDAEMYGLIKELWSNNLVTTRSSFSSDIYGYCHIEFYDISQLSKFLTIVVECYEKDFLYNRVSNSGKKNIKGWKYVLFPIDITDINEPPLIQFVPLIKFPHEDIKVIYKRLRKDKDVLYEPIETKNGTYDELTITQNNYNKIETETKELIQKFVDNKTIQKILSFGLNYLKNNIIGELTVIDSNSNMAELVKILIVSHIEIISWFSNDLYSGIVFDNWITASTFVNAIMGTQRDRLYKQIVSTWKYEINIEDVMEKSDSHPLFDYSIKIAFPSSDVKIIYSKMTK